MLISRFWFLEISSHFDLQFLREIKVKFDDFLFHGIVLKFSFIIYHFPQFISSIHRPIWSNSKRLLEISLIPCRLNPYLPLYPSIWDVFIKLVSLDFVLKRGLVQLTTSRSRFVSTYHFIQFEVITLNCTILGIIIYFLIIQFL